MIGLWTRELIYKIHAHRNTGVGKTNLVEKNIHIHRT